jgi:hypothetical protein
LLLSSNRSRWVAPPQARADSLRQEIDRLAGSADFIESERDKAGRPLVVLAAASRVLPDDTYLTEMELQKRKVTLTGRSAAAARLIGPAPVSQGHGSSNAFGRLRSYVRPVWCGRMTAGPDGLRGSGPKQGDDVLSTNKFHGVSRSSDRPIAILLLLSLPVPGVDYGGCGVANLVY